MLQMKKRFKNVIKCHIAVTFTDKSEHRLARPRQSWGKPCCISGNFLYFPLKNRPQAVIVLTQ